MYKTRSQANLKIWGSSYAQGFIGQAILTLRHPEPDEGSRLKARSQANLKIWGHPELVEGNTN